MFFLPTGNVWTVNFHVSCSWCMDMTHGRGPGYEHSMHSGTDSVTDKDAGMDLDINMDTDTRHGHTCTVK
jgi:hypothetical protein